MGFPLRALQVMDLEARRQYAKPKKT